MLGCGFAPPLDLACNDLARAHCNLLSQCSNDTDVTRIYGTLDTCVARLAASCVMTAQAQDSGADATRVEACVFAFQHNSCFDFFCE